ncbi:acyltransferase family protein [Pseudalkalibacillus hwajinpoensis]|uniref:Acyltransferase n=1 Tax=Guptibacillus hwajinpoensis TaxID=208199 RepID=A0A4U1MJH6_9BACL|nr:acyltransferase [Pseudalkalibacillus hwajinpoensis]TKD70744.1 acyltransferase [Pseudalkalibacillus hwajinpoensis]
MINPSSQLKVNEYQSFEGIRGVAALMVFFSHAVSMFYTGELKFIFWDGATAVNIFFILSGFFLSLNYVNESNRPVRFSSYIIKRFFRLYPVYLAGMFFAIMVQYTVFQPGTMTGLSEWINSKWTTSPTSSDILGYILVFGASTDSINSTMWAMRVFIYVSLLFPLVIVPLKKMDSYFGLFALFILSCVAHIAIPFLKFLPIFVIGGILAKYHKKLFSLMEIKLKNKFFSVSLFLFALFLINIRFYMPLFFNKSMPEHGLSVDPIMAVGWVIILYFSYKKINSFQFLKNKYVCFLGKISYSFYIVHFPILLGITSVMYPLTNNIYLCISISLIIVLLVAILFYKFVEQPSHNLGRLLSKKIKSFPLRAMGTGSSSH